MAFEIKVVSLNPTIFPDRLVVNHAHFDRWKRTLGDHLPDPVEESDPLALVELIDDRIERCFFGFKPNKQRVHDSVCRDK
jgi:hypothetical protein